MDTDLQAWCKEIRSCYVIHWLTGADPLPVLQSACDDLYVIMLSGRPEARIKKETIQWILKTSCTVPEIIGLSLEFGMDWVRF